MSALPACPDCGSQDWEIQLIGNSSMFMRHREADGWYIDEEEDVPQGDRDPGCITCMGCGHNAEDDDVGQEVLDHYYAS